MSGYAEAERYYNTATNQTEMVQGKNGAVNVNLSGNAYDSIDDMIKVKSMQNKWRDTFAGVAVDPAKWDISVGAGMTPTVSGGTLALATGTTASSITTYTSKAMFTIPMRAMFGFMISALPGAGQQVFLEFISVDPVTGVPDGKSSCGWLIDNGGTTSQAKYFVQTAGASALISGVSTVNVMTAYQILETEAFADECWFHTRQMDSTNGRNNCYVRHQQLPDPNAFYKMRLRFVNGATPTNITVTFQYVLVNDYAELTAEITAGRGNNAIGQSMAVQVLNTPTVNIGNTTNVTLTSGGSIYAETATNLGSGATYTGTSHDGGSPLNYTRLRVVINHVAGNTPGHLVIQQSTDNATWKETHRVPVPSDTNNRHMEFPWSLRYIRVLFVNGATAQTAMFIQSLGVKSDGNFDFDKTLAFVETTTALGISGVYTGNTYNLGGNFSFNRVRCMVFADQAGTLAIQQSRDGATWRTLVSQAITASTPLIVESMVACQYVRVVYTNGGVAQGAFELETALVRQ